ncbi:MAG: DivIVA domain-containing protein [Bacilli bacterium]|jgi:DivIVA domain-containing protein|nr:DivIVA domain-containing protein [Bacilli bacterium]
MATVKLVLDSNKILHKEFEGTKPGYDALQVDSFLDIVIKDYEAFEAYTSDVDEETALLNSKIKLLNEQLSAVEAENVSLKSRLSGITNNSEASLNNLELLKRISALEKALAKAGINPNTVE